MKEATEKFKIIEELTSRDNNLLNITWLCEIGEVSRSGYYNWLSNKDKRNEKDKKDKVDFDVILEAYNHRGYDKGAKGIYMQLLHKGVVMNIKKIRRLMKKFNLFCPIRKANPYRRMAKAMKSNNIAEDLVKRNFRKDPRSIILTDITYMFYDHKQKKAYLSVMKDAFTKEVLSYVLSKSLEVDFILETIEQLFQKHRDTIKTRETIIHSDQGSHYTCILFQELLKNKELRQSMSRRGNCWDNAPQESFFGHMKDEIDIENCQSIEQLKDIIDDYMDYYNHERYQWELAKLSPVEYFRYYTTGVYPLKQVYDPEELKS